MDSRRKAKYLPAFRRDLNNVLAESAKEFGLAAAERYAALVTQALQDLIDLPTRPGSGTRPSLATNVRLYHLSFSRNQVEGGTVKTPRHFILYRYTESEVQFARLLYDRYDLDQHIPGGLLSTGLVT